MAFAAYVLFVVPAVLLLLGGVIIWHAVLSLRGRSASRAAGVLKLIAGGGVVICGLISVSGLFVEMHYAVVAFPILGLLGALIWGLGFLTAGVVTESLARRPQRVARPGPGVEDDRDTDTRDY